MYNLDGYTIAQIADGVAGEPYQRLLHSACGLCDVTNFTICEENNIRFVICDMEFDSGSIEEACWRFSLPITDPTYEDLLVAHGDALACERIMVRIKSIL